MPADDYWTNATPMPEDNFFALVQKLRLRPRVSRTAVQDKLRKMADHYETSKEDALTIRLVRALLESLTNAE